MKIFTEWLAENNLEWPWPQTQEPNRKLLSRVHFGKDFGTPGINFVQTEDGFTPVDGKTSQPLRINANKGKAPFPSLKAAVAAVKTVDDMPNF